MMLKRIHNSGNSVLTLEGKKWFMKATATFVKCDGVDLMA